MTNEIAKLIQQAERLIAAGDLSGARTIYQQVCDRDHQNADAWLALGVLHNNLGDAPSSQRCLQQAISLRPDHAPTSYNLAWLYRARGDFVAALQLLARTVEIDPAFVPAWLLAADLHGIQGDFNRAAQSCHRAVAAQPENPDAHHMLATALFRTGDSAAAEQHFRTALQLQPDRVDAYIGLAALLVALGRIDEAVTALEEAVAVQPEHARAWFTLGQLLRTQRNTAAAINACRRAIGLDPRSADAHYQLGMALSTGKQFRDAAIALATAVALRPDFSDAHLQLAYVHENLQDYTQALEHFRQVARIQPDSADAQIGIGYVSEVRRDYATARRHYEHAIELNPQHAHGHCCLGNILGFQVMHADAEAHYRKAIALDPSHRVAHTNLLCTLNYSAGKPVDAVFAEHVKWAQKHAPDSVPPPHTNKPDPHKRLRIGYLSPDLYHHAVTYFFEPIMLNHDKSAVETFCYAEVDQPDEVTEKFKRLADHWRDSTTMNDRELSDRIRADDIDIVIDLAGHTKGSRLVALAAKPAPIQISFLGYPNTTGMHQIDYRISDAIADPPGVADEFFTETLIRLPGCFLCYKPPLDSPPVGPPPALANGHITFGSCNNLAKITEPVIAAWSDILKAVPRSHLLLKNVYLQDAGTRARFAAIFAERGINGHRIRLLPPLHPYRKHLNTYNEIDIALDTFPYNGTTTTCESLWMGVPVVTVAGSAHAGRVGATLLTAAGLPEFIAHSVHDYHDIAIRTAGNLTALTHLRSTLRERLGQSVLCAAQGYTRDLERAYREMWVHWCQSGQ